MRYEPNPIETSEVVMDESLDKLSERLAENTHEVWARRRLQDGWTFGAERNDARKTHPCLIPYNDLPDSEKEYDRQTAIETLKAIVKLGYRIEPPAASAPIADLESSESSARQGSPRAANWEELQRIVQDPKADLERLLPIWRTPIEDRDGWDGDFYSQLANRILQSGEPLLAHDIATAGLSIKAWSNHLRLRQLQGLSLTRAGAAARANHELAKLYEEGHRDTETLGALARTHKDLGVEASGRARRLLEAGEDAEACRREAQEHLDRAFSLYEQAYADSQGESVWTGINAAMLALTRGDEPKSATIATQVFERCEVWRTTVDSQKLDIEAYWAAATMGEAQLILRNFATSGYYYRKAAEIGKRLKRFGDMASTRLQARRILDHFQLDRKLVDDHFQIPKVAVFVGHMIDHPGRPPERGDRFPPSLEKQVKAEIRSQLEKHGVRIGYSSGACGSDILFLESMLELGGEIHVVLPYGRDQFMKDSVDIIPGALWRERLSRILSKAEARIAAPQRLKWGGISFEFVNRVLHGMAEMRARQLDADLVRLAVWDGEKGDGPGGTASAVERWRSQGHQPTIIRIDRIPRLSEDDTVLLGPLASSESLEAIPSVPDASKKTLSATATATTSIDRFRDHDEEVFSEEFAGFSARIAAILFADVVGFSQLTEDEIPRFSTHFLGLASRLLDNNAPIKKNTWGDGLYVVFKTVQEAARFALDLRDSVSNVRWEEKGLPKTLNLRIGLHAGPVYVGVDPVTGQTNCMGTHVSHAARIEPITPPGEVYASQSFAALAADEGLRDFQIHYIGQTPLAKNYGIYPTYHVHRRS